MAEGLSVERLNEIEAMQTDDEIGIHTPTCAMVLDFGDADCDCGLTQAFAELLSEVRRLREQIGQMVSLGRCRCCEAPLAACVCWASTTCGYYTADGQWVAGTTTTCTPVMHRGVPVGDEEGQ